MERDQSNISKLIRCIKEKAKEGGFETWEDIIYENDLGHGRKDILSEVQKRGLSTSPSKTINTDTRRLT